MTRIITVVLHGSTRAASLEKATPDSTLLVEAIADAFREARLGEVLSVVVEEDNGED